MYMYICMHICTCTPGYLRSHRTCLLSSVSPTGEYFYEQVALTRRNLPKQTKTNQKSMRTKYRASSKKYQCSKSDFSNKYQYSKSDFSKQYQYT